MLASPAIVAGVFILTFLIAVLPAVAMRDSIGAHLGGSLAANEVADRVGYDWWQEFSAQARGLGTSLSPTIIGFAATLDNLSDLLDGRAETLPVTAALALYLAGWAFLSGGILDRYARQRATRAHGFFAASGVYVFRLLRLAAVAGLVYWWLFAFVHPWLFDEQYVTLTRDVTVERTAAWWRFGFYIAFGAPLVLVNVLFDYAKVRTVVEDRHSVVGALLAALRFLRRRPWQALGLYALNAASFAVLIAAWAFFAPGAGSAGASMWAAFLAGQLYVLARLLLKLQFLASQTSLFQANLAHATYAAAPVPVWPDSPAAEAIAPAAE